MNDRRLQRIERQLQKDMGEIFLSETRQLAGILVSVTKVRISPDLSVSKVYLSIFPSSKSKEMIENINRQKKAIRYDLGLRIGKYIRRVPELNFFLDDSIDYLEKIDHLLNQDKEKDI